MLPVIVDVHSIHLPEIVLTLLGKLVGKALVGQGSYRRLVGLVTLPVLIDVELFQLPKFRLLAKGRRRIVVEGSKSCDTGLVALPVLVVVHLVAIAEMVVGCVGTGQKPAGLALLQSTFTSLVALPIVIVLASFDIAESVAIGVTEVR